MKARDHVKVHIVIADSKSDWIITRLARHLVNYNDWGIGRRPEAGVDANVYFTYIDQKFHANPAGTKAVGFMTHHEDGTKGRIWDRLAPKFDLRICMARMYARELEKMGPTVHIPVCIELDKFKPRPLPERDKPRVGVGGTVYKSGRKGEDLALRLKRYNSHRWEMVASGKPMANAGDWPIKTRHYPWASMEQYYWTLNAFLCTSLIEGGPVTVLEALACGRPVIIPRGVGLEEELPDSVGIWRYKKGDYRSMVKAIEAAVRVKVPPERLRGYVVERTPKRWASSWRSVLKTALFSPAMPKVLSVPAVPKVSSTPVVPSVPVVPRKPLPPITESNAGVYMVAYGHHAHDCAYHLIRTIHKYSPGIPVCLTCEGFNESYERPIVISGKGKGSRYYDDKGYCEPLSQDHKKVLEKGDTVLALPMKDRRARSQKTKIWGLAPREWEYVLYLDADILVNCRLKFFFDILRDGWDMVVTLSPPQGPLVRHAQRDKYREENIKTNRVLHGNHWLQPSGGVWAFRRNERTEQFLRTFHAEWKQWQHTDQQSMARAMFKVPLRIWYLGTEFNTFMHHEKEAPRSLGIRHFATAARAWTVKHEGRNLWRKWSKKL